MSRVIERGLVAAAPQLGRHGHRNGGAWAGRKPPVFYKRALPWGFWGDFVGRIRAPGPGILLAMNGGRNARPAAGPLEEVAVDALDAQALFALDEARFRELAPAAVERRYARGEVLWMAGEEPESVCLVRSGRVNMGIQGCEGSSTLVQFCTRGQAFCPAAVLVGRGYACAAVAAEDTVALTAPRSAFLGFIACLPQLARDLLRQMAAQVCDSHCRQALRNAPVKHRLAGLLGSLNQRYAGRALPFTRRELADMSGTTVESAIRTLSAWEKDGVIQSGRGSIHVRRPGALEEAAV